MRCRSECSAGLSVGPECFSHLYIGPELSALAVGARLITFILSCQFLVQTSYLPLNVNKVPAKLNNNIWGQCSCTVAGQRPSPTLQKMPPHRPPPSGATVPSCRGSGWTRSGAESGQRRIRFQSKCI